MKKVGVFILLVFTALPVFAKDIRSGEDLISAMHKKYDGKWYKTLTFVQTTTNYKPDGTSEASTWYEAMSVPGKLRIDFAPIDKGDGILFADNNVYSFRDGKAVGSPRPFVHPLLVLGFDVYMQPVETSVSLLKGMNIDMSTIHQEKWQGKTVYVVGAKQGDLKTPQFWVDKKDLLFVRLFELAGKNKQSVHESQFNDYKKVKNGWVSAEVQFFVDGKRSTTEEYTYIQTDIPLDASLWAPEKWMIADRSYYKKKP